ncbi:hypothetical protein ON010_g8529 [Phytophthora cinnamomi]|nr:hypothetical protein ON010_g8529 [Phytophthora cinnamomi]
MASYLFEKHLAHQDGVAGTLSIRLVAARNLRAAASMFWVRTCNPYVIFRVGKQSVRSSTIPGNDNPTWRRELLEVKLPKLDLKRQPLAEHSDVRLELIVDAMNEDSLTGKATEAVGMANGSVIGTAAVDLTPLVEGKEDVLDQWIPLSGALPVVGGAAAGKKQQQSDADLSLVRGLRLVPVGAAGPDRGPGAARKEDERKLPALQLHDAVGLRGGAACAPQQRVRRAPRQFLRPVLRVVHRRAAGVRGQHAHRPVGQGGAAPVHECGTRVQRPGAGGDEGHAHDDVPRVHSGAQCSGGVSGRVGSDNEAGAEAGASIM